MKLRRALTLALALALTAGACERSEPLPAAAGDYGREAAAVAAAAGLAWRAPEPPARGSLRYPSRRQISLTIAADSLNLIEFLRLSRCDLHRVIAAHNNVLNRVQDQVEVLFYAAEFIASAESCLAAGSDGALMDKLAQARGQKRAAMPVYTYNAIFASREVRQLFSPFVKLDDLAALNGPLMPTAIEELRELARVLPQAAPGFDFDAARSRFDLALGRLNEHRQAGAVMFYGQWLLGYATAGAELERKLAASGRCDLVERLKLPGAGLSGELERLRMAAARVDELLTLAPADTPLARAYLEPHWQPLASALRDWRPPARPCAAEPDP